MLNRLLGDAEAEVRTQAVFRIPNVGGSLSDADRATILATNVMPHLVEVCNDRFGVPSSLLFTPFLPGDFVGSARPERGMLAEAHAPPHVGARDVTATLQRRIHTQHVLPPCRRPSACFFFL